MITLKVQTIVTTKLNNFFFIIAWTIFCDFSIFKGAVWATDEVPAVASIIDKVAACADVDAPEGSCEVKDDEKEFEDIWDPFILWLIGNCCDIVAVGV